MGQTYHEDGAAELLDGILSDPDAARIFAMHRTRLKEGSDAYPPGLVDAIGQIHARTPGTWPLEQAASFVHVFAGLMSGAYAHGVIKLGETPGADRDRQKNAANLSRLPDMFSAQLDLEQQGQESDGVLRWVENIKIFGSTGVPFLPNCSVAAPEPIYTALRIQPRSVPLEVGFTMPSRTMVHLDLHGGVARWPYGSEDIHLLVKVNRWGTSLGL